MIHGSRTEPSHGDPPAARIGRFRVPWGRPEQRFEIQPKARSSRTRVAFVLWSGDLGGAQLLTAEVAGALRRYQVDARIVFVCGSDGLRNRLNELAVPYEALGMSRGREVIWHRSKLAQCVSDAGDDCAVLVSSGYLAASLRLGGYRRPIAAVEHGTLLQVDQLPYGRRLLRQFDRASGLWACDVEVAVSKYMLEALRTRRHAKRLICIQNGVDLQRFSPKPRNRNDSTFTLGYAGRLVAAKGVGDVIRAFATTPIRHNSRLLIAGEGPERDSLQSLAQRSDVASRIRFLGRIQDVPHFWHMCDIGVVPSAGWVESFSLAAVEAMACGRPIVASRVGALPDTIDEGKTGTVVDQGDIEQLAQAFERYARDAPLRHEHGAAARRLCEQRYDFVGTVRRYGDLVAALAQWPSGNAELALPRWDTEC
jgi:glycosyltransferase involved in cell wall biosynthesis